MICAEEKEVEVEMTEAVVQCLFKKKSRQVDLHKSFVFLSVLSLLDLDLAKKANQLL